MVWESLLTTASFDLRRSGRFLVAALTEPHLVLSTSARNGGMVDHNRWLVNHQSCEGTAHLDRHKAITDAGLDRYHDVVCEEIGLPSGQTAVLGTAANMNYAAIVTAADDGLEVTAAVTAGVEGNATSAGEPAMWRETAAGVQKVPAYAGTINTILLINRPLTPAALARAVVTMTEGKSAALQRLAVPSKQHIDLATGTGTDQYCIAAPAAGAVTLTSASPHMKLGELIGRAARDATLEALRWQNGLEVSYTRGVFHALGRFGVREATVLDEIAPYLSPEALDLLKKNSKAVFYEPLVGASAHALAAVCDRIRHGTLPASVGPDAMTQHAAAIAANLAAQVHRWSEFRALLRPHAAGDVKPLVLRAIALGWTEKWRSGEPDR
ncbi:MAG TPA: adenosylcobinamide amidohydrolase [Vicinamibacterales bacterium]|nr:adenosylcobinamide amidohydrolase [Vicinamibacterales bacterium]